MSVEALWAVQFGAVNGQTLVNRSGGIVVLESGRIFGGDTWAFYTGDFKLNDNRMSIRIKVGIHFTEGGESIFGGPLRDLSLHGEALVNHNHSEITAELRPDELDGVILVAHLRRVAGLP